MEVILEASYLIVSGGEFVPRNVILRHMQEMAVTMQKRALASEILYSYVIKRIPEDCGDLDLFMLEAKILRAFFESRKWLTDTRIENCLTMLLEKYCVRDEDALIALIECINSRFGPMVGVLARN